MIFCREFSEQIELYIYLTYKKILGLEIIDFAYFFFLIGYNNLKMFNSYSDT